MSQKVTPIPHPRKKRYTVGDVLIFITLTLIALLIFTPFYNALVISLESSRGYVLHPVSLYPTEPTINNYAYVIKNGNILTGYMSTIIITVAGTALVTIVPTVAELYIFPKWLSSWSCPFRSRYDGWAALSCPDP